MRIVPSPPRVRSGYRCLDQRSRQGHSLSQLLFQQSAEYALPAARSPTGEGVHTCCYVESVEGGERTVQRCLAGVNTAVNAPESTCRLP